MNPYGNRIGAFITYPLYVLSVMATTVESETGQPVTETPSVIESRRSDDVDTDDLTLITDTMEVDMMVGTLGLKEDYDGALVYSSEGGYTEVWFFTGAVLYDHTMLYRYV